MVLTEQKVQGRRSVSLSPERRRRPDWRGAVAQGQPLASTRKRSSTSFSPTSGKTRRQKKSEVDLSFADLEKSPNQDRTFFKSPSSSPTATFNRCQQQQQHEQRSPPSTPSGAQKIQSESRKASPDPPSPASSCTTSPPRSNLRYKVLPTAYPAPDPAGMVVADMGIIAKRASVAGTTGNATASAAPTLLATSKPAEAGKKPRPSDGVVAAAARLSSPGGAKAATGADSTAGGAASCTTAAVFDAPTLDEPRQRSEFSATGNGASEGTCANGINNHDAGTAGNGRSSLAPHSPKDYWVGRITARDHSISPPRSGRSARRSICRRGSSRASGAGMVGSSSRRGFSSSPESPFGQARRPASRSKGKAFGSYSPDRRAPFPQSPTPGTRATQPPSPAGAGVEHPVSPGGGGFSFAASLSAGPHRRGHASLSTGRGRLASNDIRAYGPVFSASGCSPQGSMRRSAGAGSARGVAGAGQAGQGVFSNNPGEYSPLGSSAASFLLSRVALGSANNFGRDRFGSSSPVGPAQMPFCFSPSSREQRNAAAVAASLRDSSSPGRGGVTFGGANSWGWDRSGASNLRPGQITREALSPRLGAPPRRRHAMATGSARMSASHLPSLSPSVQVESPERTSPRTMGPPSDAGDSPERTGTGAIVGGDSQSGEESPAEIGGGGGARLGGLLRELDLIAGDVGTAAAGNVEGSSGETEASLADGDYYDTASAVSSTYTGLTPSSSPSGRRYSPYSQARSSVNVADYSNVTESSYVAETPSTVAADDAVWEGNRGHGEGEEGSLSGALRCSFASPSGRGEYSPFSQARSSVVEYAEVAATTATGDGDARRVTESGMEEQEEQGEKEVSACGGSPCAVQQGQSQPLPPLNDDDDGNGTAVDTTVGIQTLHAPPGVLQLVDMTPRETVHVVDDGGELDGGGTDVPAAAEGIAAGAAGVVGAAASAASASAAVGSEALLSVSAASAERHEQEQQGQPSFLRVCTPTGRGDVSDLSLWITTREESQTPASSAAVCSSPPSTLSPPPRPLLHGNDDACPGPDQESFYGFRINDTDTEDRDDVVLPVRSGGSVQRAGASSAGAELLSSSIMEDEEDEEQSGVSVPLLARGRMVVSGGSTGDGFEAGAEGDVIQWWNVGGMWHAFSQTICGLLQFCHPPSEGCEPL